MKQQPPAASRWGTCFTWYLTVKHGFVRRRAIPSEYEKGLLTGLLIGEGHFGGDGRQPQIVLRMHVRHEALFRWIDGAFPGGKLYGPYHHDGRHYFQWMARGSFLRDELVPMLAERLSPELDTHSYARFDTMRTRYARNLGSAGAGGGTRPAAAGGSPP